MIPATRTKTVRPTGLTTFPSPETTSCYALSVCMFIVWVQTFVDDAKAFPPGRGAIAGQGWRPRQLERCKLGETKVVRVRSIVALIFAKN